VELLHIPSKIQHALVGKADYEFYNYSAIEIQTLVVGKGFQIQIAYLGKSVSSSPMEQKQLHKNSSRTNRIMRRAD
jgi:hypothetical protein